MDIPLSEEDARDHIAAIRATKRLDDDESSDLENALVILAEQLYQKSTHFLLELIQNADDNNYDQLSTPTLNIILSERTMRIDCNEIGFSKRNAEAICKIGKSTKAGLDKATRYIGEKGIGFKSVFKIADVVWIQSGYYSFKFDKYAKLGMIAPIWTPFPHQPKPGYTSMYLQLAEDCDTSELVNDVKSLDPRLLIFLRKLREINITVEETPSSIWKTTLRCQNVETTEGEGLISLLQDGDSRSYKIIRHPISGLPLEPKRLGCHDSEILLAFPLDKFEGPLIASQNVYAFLPIRDYGFKFLIQADFLLIASREDIDSSAWNQKLLRSIPYAFRQAVDQFNSGDLRYMWIKFLQKRSPLPDFFYPLEAAIIQALVDSPIIESQSGELMAPSKLRVVPGTMLGEDKRPFIPTELARSKYISPKYPYEKHKAELVWLGVKELTPEEFIEDLEIFIESSPEEFQNMCQIWHKRLCKLLQKISDDSPVLMGKVAELKIIPLRDGRWVSSTQETLYFSESTSAKSKAIRIPNGIPITEIDCEAASNRFRRSFFVFLGARMWTTDIVCQEIISMHASSPFVPEQLPREDLVSHVMFLFHAGWASFPVDSTCLWLSTETGSVRVSNETYIDSDKAGSASSCFGRNRKNFSFIHDDYIMEVPPERQSQLRDWMVANLGIAELPRLVAHSGPTFRFSEDFRFLLENSGYVSVLLLLRDCWDHYAKWIIQDNSSEDSDLEICKQQVREAFGRISVSCKGGGSARLRDTMLPTHNMEASTLASLSFIEIPDPENSLWRQLIHFGVVVTAGIGPFIKCISILKESESTLEKASELYKQIYIQCNSDRSLIPECKKLFKSEDLIFTPRSEDWTGDEWLGLESCVWEGPPCLKKTACLSQIYPEHHPFFCSMLGLTKADWTTLADEARQIEACDSVDYISDVFVTISEYLQTSEKSKASKGRTRMIAQLTKSTIFPVDEGKSETTFDYLSTSGTDVTWFIADRPHLKRAFQGHIPLLALSEESIGKIGSLITALNWNRRLLSRLARGVPDAGGDAQLNYRYTRSICSRARYIARLLPSKLENRRAIIEQLCNSKVYTVEKITLQWAVKIPNGKAVVGRADSGRVKITPAGRVLEVFLRKGDSDISRPPLELLEELTTFCQLTDASHVSLLHWVMTETDIGEMEAIFERRGLQNDAPEVKAMIDSQLLNPHFWAKSRIQGQRDGEHAEDREAALDAVSSFMARFNAINQWDNTKGRPWSKTNTDSMLSHLCRLENVDPYVLLPQTNLSLWNERLRQAGAFPDDPTSISFLHEASDDVTKRHLRPTRLFPALVEMNRARETIVKMLPDSTVNIGTTVILAGEVYVSKLLESELGDAYQPQVHWTSSLRRKAGLSPFTGNEIESSTFTIGDRNGSYAFTQMLIRKGNRMLQQHTKFPVYHIEVVTTEGGLLSEFALEPFQVQRAWKCHQNRRFDHAGVASPDVFVLIRISDVQENPQIALFIDPWQTHAMGNLQLKSESRYLAQFKTSPSASIRWNAAENCINSEEVRSSRKRKRSTFGSVVEPDQGGASFNRLYSYTPLRIQQIRLLELLSGHEGDPVKGNVRHVSISEDPKFRAISYAWGPALKPFHLHTPDGSIPLTSSLHAALKRLRSSTESIFLWADAICIDQVNVHEKASQIRLLPTIFQSAELVLAWIGNDENESYQALETLLQIRTNEVKPDVWPVGVPPIPSEWQHPGLPPTKSRIWAHIAAIFQREWFQRAWIIQEIVLATEVKVVCGAWEISWDDVFAAIKLCLDWSSTLGVADNRVREMLSSLKPAYTLAQTRTAFKKTELSPRFNMLALLDQFAHTHSTKECDKLFALLGISFDVGTAAFDPDYLSSIETIIRRYAAEFIRRGHAMDLLHRSGTSKSYPFSSWIPNWTSKEPCRTISTWRGANGIFSAGGPPTEYAQLVPDNSKHLQVTGVVIDRVVKIGSTSTASSDLITVINSLSEIIDGLGDYPTGESRRELMAKIPIGNAIKPCEDDIGSFQAAISEEDEDPYSNFRWNDCGNDIQSIQDMVEFFKQNQDERNITWKYWCTAAAFLKRLSDGKFFVTDRGYIGVGPREIMVNDQICVFAGGGVPFVLEEKHRTWRLIGECYVHGIMYGESGMFVGVEQQDFVLE